MIESEKILEIIAQFHNITQVAQAGWLIHHTLHECSETAQTCLKLLLEFILSLLSFPSRGGRMLVLSSKYNIEQADFAD